MSQCVKVPAYTPSQNCSSLSKLYKTSKSITIVSMYHGSMTVRSPVLRLIGSNVHDEFMASVQSCNFNCSVLVTANSLKGGYYQINWGEGNGINILALIDFGFSKIYDSESTYAPERKHLSARFCPVSL